MKERPIIFSGPMVAALLAGRKTQTRRPVKNLRVRLRHEITSDPPAIVRPVVKAREGVYPAKLNLAGAVAVELPREPGSAVRPFLGVKPHEFDFVCPYADGHTYLRRHPDGRMAWHLQVPEGQKLWVRETFWAELETEFVEATGSSVVWGPHLDNPSTQVQYVATPPNPERPDEPGAWYGPDEMFPERSWIPWGDGNLVSPAFQKCPALHVPRWASRLLLEVESVRLERLHAITEEDARAEGFSLADAVKHQVPSARDVFRLRWDEMYGDGDFEWDRSPWAWVICFRRVEAARSAA